VTTFDRASLVAQLKKHEAVKLKPYVDSVGKLTIGVGRNLDDVGITSAEADFLLQGDIDRVVRGLLARYPIWFGDLDPVRQAVLVNMAFNLGLAGLAGFTTMLAAVAAHQFDLASRAMLNSKWAAQVGGRAIELADQMSSGKWSA
jgi:lysozyme